MSANLVHSNLKHQFVLERLLEKGVTHSQQGVSVHNLDYESLKYELVLLAFREIDVDSDANVWF